jgi:hypothetical protein
MAYGVQYILQFECQYIAHQYIDEMYEGGHLKEQKVKNFNGKA